MSHISFELPFHGKCVTNQVLLHTPTSPIIDFLDLIQSGLEEMPDAIILNYKRYKYAGVSDGHG